MSKILISILLGILLLGIIFFLSTDNVKTNECGNSKDDCIKVVCGGESYKYGEGYVPCKNQLKKESDKYGMVE